MNKNYKLSILLIVILFLAYVYMNLPADFRLQFGGADKIKIPPECVPFMYKFRYIFYIFPLLLIVFNFYYGSFTIKAANFKYEDYGKIFLTGFAENTLNYATLEPDTKANYDYLVKECNPSKNGMIAEDVSKFCDIVAPVSCCNVPGYLHPERCCDWPGLDDNIRKKYCNKT
jgi:hypothetical protein